MTSATHFSPGPTPTTVRTPDGKVLSAPEGWILLPPGDAALTRRVKLAGEHWIVSEKRGRKVFSRGIWCPAATVERIRAHLEAERSTEAFAKKKAAGAVRREKEQVEYVEDFHAAVVTFLSFDGRYGSQPSSPRTRRRSGAGRWRGRSVSRCRIVPRRR